MATNAKIETLKNQLNSVPEKPGVYLWKNAEGAVIYVGKAKRLRTRMRQYVNFQDDRQKIPLLVADISSFDYIVVTNEHEALVLEKQLIDRYSPYYNADFKDDKSYPYIAITKGDVFPAIKYTREKHAKTTRYFGPYTDSRAARRIVEIVRKVVPICSTKCTYWRRLKKNIDKFGEDDLARNAYLVSLGDKKPCFDCHVGLGPGPCCYQTTVEEYAENVAKVEKFLNGNHKEILEDLDSQIKTAATDLNFERAQRLQDRVATINNLSDKQNIVSHLNINADIFGVFREETIAGVYVFVVREGRIINTNEFVLNRGLDVANDELLHMLMLRYYDETTSIPHEIIVGEKPDDWQTLQDWLTKKLASKHGAKVSFDVPVRGDRKKMLDMATINAKHTLGRYKVRFNYEDARKNQALLELESALSMEQAPLRIECFDISTNHGTYTVASMVVFSKGASDKGQYRRFKVKTPLEEANDFLCMQEVLRRRYNADKLKDKKFGSVPNLILLDGGKPQLSAAIEIFDEIGFDWSSEGITLAGLAKSDEEIFVARPGTTSVDFEHIILPDGAASLYLVKQVRDESHRFAITFHRQLREKGMTKSILEEVPGLGPVRTRALLKKIGGFRKLQAASLQQIKDTQTIPLDVAEELFAILQQYSKR